MSNQLNSKEMREVIEIICSKYPKEMKEEKMGLVRDAGYVKKSAVDEFRDFYNKFDTHADYTTELYQLGLKAIKEMEDAK